MLYTKGFMLTGALATALVLAARSSIHASAAAPSRTAPGTAPKADELSALNQLSDAVGAHAFPRQRLSEPDHAVADHARNAAELTAGSTRETLLTLADSASRSALEFLVDYNLVASDWEATTGLRMSPAIPSPE